MDAEKQAELLKPFAPEQIHQLPKGGTTLDYVGHAEVTRRLLQVDPEWNWEPMAFTADGLPSMIIADNGNPIGLWIKLTICGVTRLGFGSCLANKGESEKELIGDAIRNAAMRFGVALDLWSKTPIEQDGSFQPRREPGGWDNHRAPQQMARQASPAAPAAARAPGGNACALANGKPNWTYFYGTAKALGYDQGAVKRFAGVDSLGDWSADDLQALLQRMRRANDPASQLPPADEVPGDACAYPGCYATATRLVNGELCCADDGHVLQPAAVGAK